MGALLKRLLCDTLATRGPYDPQQQHPQGPRPVGGFKPTLRKRQLGSLGETLALADPNPLTTEEICDSIAESITSKRSVITPPSKLVETFLNSPLSPPLTGLPHSGVPYFFIPQTYDTAVAEELLSAHGISCPSFTDYVGNLVSFVEAHPKL